MKLAPIIIAGLLITSTYSWWQGNNDIEIILPNDAQKKEMLGTSNTPSIPLSPLQH
ncbi:hypothetical protein THO17_17230 [Marinomonas sp. THO17]